MKGMYVPLTRKYHETHGTRGIIFGYDSDTLYLAYEAY